MVAVGCKKASDGANGSGGSSGGDTPTQLAKAPQPTLTAEAAVVATALSGASGAKLFKITNWAAIKTATGKTEADVANILTVTAKVGSAAKTVTVKSIRQDGVVTCQVASVNTADVVKITVKVKAVENRCSASDASAELSCNALS